MGQHQSLRAFAVLLWAGAMLSTAACKDSGEKPGTDAGENQVDEFLFTQSELEDPEACQGCHPGQYAEWAGSMHAYAAEDPVFLAMNRRGQEETNGALGDFCVRCHAPLAVEKGLTRDGLNLDDVPAKYRGINCYFCHSIASIEGRHNNALTLAEDGVMLGPFRDPQPNMAHASAYSKLLDTEQLGSSRACGACHDVTLPAEIAGRDFPLERTFAEWEETLFNRAHAEGGLGCTACHMPVSRERERSANVSDAPRRASRRHDFEGIDLALTPFPNIERQRFLVQRFLDTSLLAEICVSRLGAIEVTLENAGSGHSWPSGASQDREPWLDVKAYDADGTTLYSTLEPTLHTESADGGLPETSGDLVLLKDFVVDEDGNPAHMFWDVRELASSTVLKGVVTRDPLSPDFHRERARYLLNTQQASSAEVARVTLLVRVRPIALEVLDDLVESGHLDASFVDTMPVLDVLPDRCPDESLRERYPNLSSSNADCEDTPDRHFTLVWARAALGEDNPAYRASRVDDVPADCLSHPTYVPSSP